MANRFSKHKVTASVISHLTKLLSECEAAQP